MKEHNQGNH